jgi:tetratricopeptide (TPR) repeat protein
LLRVKTKPLSLSDNQEWMSFTIEPSAENSAVVNLRWEKVRVPFTVEVKDVVATTIARARAAVAAAKSDDWGIPYNAAVYARDNKADADAAKWFEASLTAAEEQLKAKETFQAWQRKSTSLLALGRRDEAIAAAERAVVVGKAENANTSALEKRIADMKAGKL